MDLGFTVAVFVTLFVVIDPIGLAPIFVALTQGDWAGVVAVHLVMLAVGWRSVSSCSSPPA